MKITPEQVKKVAELARLELSTDELSTMADQLSRLVAYFEQLDELDTGGVEPTSHVLPLSCPLREDQVSPSLSRETLLSRAPAHEEEFFLVPKVIE